MNAVPNLFNYATSELSQDAFICWLIAWADEANKQFDEGLNCCAKRFVRALLSENERFVVKSVKVGRQWNNTDVWALINDRYFLVIEDKKGTQEHSDQLVRYAKAAKEFYEDKPIEIKLVFFKMEEQGNYRRVKEAGFSLFTRGTMISILHDYIELPEKNKNDIIVDYYSYLKNLDENINSYKKLPLTQWNSWYSWKGFYSQLQEYFEDSDWNYVPNPAGGFLGFWWCWSSINIDDKEFDFYLQLERDKLVFKLFAYKNEERRNVRDLYRDILFKKANELGIEIHRYGRLGAYSGVARLGYEYRITGDNGLIDMEATIGTLKNIMGLLIAVKDELQSIQKARV
jgi:hypothetical protein